MRVWLCLGCLFLFPITQSLLTVTVTGPEDEPRSAARCYLARPACPFGRVAFPVGCEGLCFPVPLLQQPELSE